MASPPNDTSLNASAPYYHPVRPAAYHTGQEYEHTNPLAAAAHMYPDMPADIPNEQDLADVSSQNFENNDQLEGLLQVANSVAAQEAAGKTAKVASRGKRKRGSSPANGFEDTTDQSLAHDMSNNLRKRPRLTHTLEQSSDASTLHSSLQHPHAHQGHSASSYVQSQNSLSDSRPPSIHSTAALFRDPSAASKKYTRPPMSKLFLSLEQSPESFLQLQSDAKAYMLDATHPERQDCVGNRGASDTDIVKLRLFNCARDFLEEDERGLRFFGEDVPGEGGKQRTWVWPRDIDKVIGLCTPLLRRMVTNERQRKYALETRGQAKVDGAKDKRDEQSGTAEARNDNIDHQKLQQSYHLYVIDSRSTKLMYPRIALPLNEDPRSSLTEVKAHIYHYTSQSGRNGTPLPSGVQDAGAVDAISNSGAVSALQQEAQRALAMDSGSMEANAGGETEYNLGVSVQTSAGLRSVGTEEEWSGAILEVLDCPWMEGEVKIIARPEQRQGTM
ncbi:MAG: hypothetical protein M1820_004934 [Bogoriella megaspora]|nr:MAG: hypothetical protein M1820_004934 [Bogoriella megaspora]